MNDSKWMSGKLDCYEMNEMNKHAIKWIIKNKHATKWMLQK